MSSNVVKCFISHTAQDYGWVKALKEKLESFDDDGSLKIWAYEEDTKLNRGLSLIKNDIDEADFLIVALSKHSIGKEWVQRELGHAVQLSRQNKKKNNDPRPHVIGVCVDPDPPARYKVRLRDFDKGKPYGEFDFSGQRYFKFHAPEIDDLRHLYEFLDLRVRFWGEDIKSLDELRELGVWEIYEEFFPNEEERDDPADIMAWLEEDIAQETEWYKGGRDERPPAERITQPMPNDWGTVFAVLEAAGRAVGMVYLSVHVRSGWVFGNYFGVRKSWRVNSRAKYFIENVREHAERRFGQLKGVVMEVEKFKEGDAARLADKVAKKRAPKLKKNEIETLRAIMRVGLYQRHGVRLLVGPAGREISYRQPAMNELKRGEKLTPSWLRAKEWDLWLMVWPFSLSSGEEFDLTEIIDFLYLDLFGSYYPRREALFRSFSMSYLDYLLALREACLKANPLVAYGVREIPGSGRRAWSQALSKGVDTPL